MSLKNPVTPPGNDPGTVRILLHIIPAIILIVYLTNGYMCCPLNELKYEANC